MRTEKEIRDKLYYAKYKVYKNGWDVDTWVKVKEILEWVLSGEETRIQEQ